MVLFQFSLTSYDALVTSDTSYANVNLEKT